MATECGLTLLQGFCHWLGPNGAGLLPPQRLLGAGNSSLLLLQRFITGKLGPTMQADPSDIDVQEVMKLDQTNQPWLRSNTTTGGTQDGDVPRNIRNIGPMSATGRRKVSPHC